MYFSLSRAWRRFRMLQQREHNRCELAEEMEMHAALKVRDYMAAGLSEQAATEAMRREMGNVTLAKEQSHDLWSFPALEHCVQDIRFALRIIRKNPAFSCTAILSLALGIAGSTAIFAFVNCLLIRPLPYAESQRWCGSPGSIRKPSWCITSSGAGRWTSPPSAPVRS